MKFKLSSFFDFLIIFLIILDTHSIFNVVIGRRYSIIMLLLVVLAVRILLNLNDILKRLNNRTIIALLLWTMYSLIYFFVNSTSNSTLISKFIILPLLLIVYFSYYQTYNKLNKLMNLYTRIMLIIATISLFFWSLGSILHILSPTGNLLIQWGKVRAVSSYFGLYFQWQNDASFMGRVFFRNVGIFAEAPMYSLHLSVAYLLDYFILKNKSKRRLVLYILTIVSSYSVTGILLVLISQALNYIFNSINSLFETKRLNLGIILIPLLVLVTLIYANQLFSEKLSSASGGSRLEDYRIGYYAWQEKPWLGHGFNNYDAINRLKSMLRFSRSSTGYTNSPMAILVEGGVFFFLSYAYTFLHYVSKSVSLKNKDLFIVSVMLIYLFATTTFQHTALMISFMIIAFIGNYKSINNDAENLIIRR